MVQVTEIDSLEKRSISYQFDLEQDIPWKDISKPGMYLGLSLLEKLGFNTELLVRNPEAMEICQWVMGLAIAEKFVFLEREVIHFIEQKVERFEPTRSSTLLVEEERKHIVLFERFCSKLRQDRPDLVPLFDAAFQPPVAFSVLEKQRSRFEPEESQWLCWMTILFFEEYTLFIARCMEKDKDSIQPVWLAAHQCHRREEAQHILTDAAYLEALPISSEQKRQLATAFICFIETDATSFFLITTWLRVQDALFPRTEYLSRGVEFKDLPICHDLQWNPVFRFTRKFLPALIRQTENTQSNSADVIALHGHSKSRVRIEHTSNLIEKFELAVNGGREIIFTSAGTRNVSITYERLFIKSEKLLAALQANGLRPKDAVVLWLKDPDEMLPVFWACVLGGLLPVVLSPSIYIDQYSEEINQLRKVLAQVNGRLVIADVSVKARLSEVLHAGGGRSTQVMSVSELADYGGGTASLWRPHAEDTVMVQFSSGSMGNPRGILLTHRNLIAVIDSMSSARGVKADDVFVSWLPLSHDMGLIGFHLTPLVVGAKQVLMSPREFMKRPTSWLQALHDYKANLTGVTNSAIERALANTTPKFIEQLDLSWLHSLIVGAEPISPRVMKRLIRAFKPAGLKPQSVCPAYGLAEASLAVTMTPPGNSPGSGQFSRRKLAHGKVSRAPNSKDLVEFTNLGLPVRGTRVRIVDDAHHVLEENMVGKIEVSGDSVTKGYIGDEAATREVLNHGWLDTGDRGFLRERQLYFVGRDDETFFVHGRNYFARDIESIAAEIRPRDSDSVILAVEKDEEAVASRQILFVLEQRKAGSTVHEALNRMHRHIQRRLGISLDEIVSIHRKDVPRTTSGKIARHLLLHRYRDGAIDGESFKYESSLCRQKESMAIQEVTYGTAGQNPKSEFFNEVEGNIRQIWAEVLARPIAEIGIDEEFRQLGGDSLSAANVLVQLENASGLYYPTELLVHGTTVKKMSGFVQSYMDRTCDAGNMTRDEHNRGSRLYEIDDIATGENVRYCPAITKIEEDNTSPGISEHSKNDSSGNYSDETKRTRKYFRTNSDYKAGKPADLQIAVIGLGIRFPSASTPDEFWKLLWEGQDAFREIPAERRHGPLWREITVSAALLHEKGTFLEDIERFDPKPFGITVEEARFIDPQQRVFLEVCSEALDHASIADRRVGVFAASGDNEYGFRYLGAPDKVSRYSLLGGLRNMIAARVSQVFGFSGPALSIDTACSASATAVHLACESLRRGECAAALAGGVQLNLSNQLYTYFSRAGLLSMKGECRPFDSDATGLVPGEGAAAVLLKPLEQSIADGDDILAVISSSAMNNDAGTLSGTAPSSAGQRRVIQAAYEYGSIDPDSVSYIEAHAAGTAVGDAVEIQSISEAFGDLRKEIPIGSVKSNIGHLLAAAGIASLIKVILMLNHKQIPSTLGCRRPTERIDFEKIPLFPVTEKTEWQVKEDTIRRAGINSFGLGGTNVHLVVDEAPASGEVLDVMDGRGIFCLYAAPTQTSFVAENYMHYLRQSCSSLEEICAASMTRGQFFRQRNAVFVASKEDLNKYLQNLTTSSEAPRDAGLVTFVLPDHGSAILEATRYLHAIEPSFRNSWDDCTACLRAEGLDLSSCLEKSSTEKESLAVSQALVFAYGVSAARLLEHLWVNPDFVTGCGVGEYAAAHLAGILSLKAAVLLVLRRAEFMCRSQEKQMAAAFTSESDIHLQQELVKELDQFSKTALNMRFISTVDGRIIKRANESYWQRHLCTPAEFAAAVNCAINNGARTFIELGGSDNSSACINDMVSTECVSVQSIQLFKTTDTGGTDVRESLASIVNAGIPVNLARSHFYRTVNRAVLPSYPYQKQRHWIELNQEPSPGSNGSVFSLDQTAISDHRMLGIPTAPLALLADHVLWEISASRNEAQELHRIVLAEGLSILPGERRRIEVGKSLGGEQYDWLIRSFGLPNEEQKEHMHGSVRPLRGRVFSTIDLDSIATRCQVFVSKDAIYETLERHGLSIGTAMQAVKSVQVGDGELLAQLETPENATRGHFVDPCLLDGASQAVSAFAYRLTGQCAALYAGFSVGAFRVFSPIRGAAIAYVRLRQDVDLSADVIRYDIILASKDGEVLLVAEDFAAKRVMLSKLPPIAARHKPESHASHYESTGDNSHPHSLLQMTAEVEREVANNSNVHDSHTSDLTRVAQHIIAKYLGVSTNKISSRVQFANLGVDSLMAVNIASALEKELGISLNSTLLFEASTLAELGRVLAEKIDLTSTSRER